MPVTELRKLLEDELDALAEPMRSQAQEARDFWRHPDVPKLSIWAGLPPLQPAPAAPTGTPTEEALYAQLYSNVKPALESRQRGFDTVPVLAAHDRYIHGPSLGTRFLPAVMGAEIVFPKDLPESERIGWRAGVRPLIDDISEIDRLEDVDVSRSAPLRAILRAYEELAEIVRGRIPFTRYSPTLPLDFAADIIGHERFFELVASDPEGAARLIGVCTDKWLHMMRLQERASGGSISGPYYEPGCYVHDMILNCLSPRAVREVVIPYNKRLSAECGGIKLYVNHPDESLLEDYLRIPKVCGIGFKQRWPSAPILSSFKNNIVLGAYLSWHYHEGKKSQSPDCLPWAEHRDRLAPFAGRLRVIATLSGWGDTAQERRECLLGDLADLRRIWEDGQADR